MPRPAFPHASLTAAALAGLVALSGCGEFPDPGGPGSQTARAAPWPTLAPVQELLATVPGDAEAADAASRALMARAANLRARAAVLRRTGLEEADRDALAAAIARHPITR